MLLHVIFVGISLLAIQAQDSTSYLSGSGRIPIPCHDDDSCRVSVNPSQQFKCISNYCLCANMTARMWELCEKKDMMVGAKPKIPSRRCDDDDDCQWLSGSKCLRQSNSSSTRCDCPELMVMSYNSSEEGQLPRCLKVAREPGAECTESIQCSAGFGDAECDEGRCKCKTKFHFASHTTRRCLPDKLFGETCTKEEESCYQLAGPHKLNALNCSSRGFCRCVKNYTPVNGTCEYSDATRHVINTSLVMVLFVVVMRMV